jgi:hypothetical protein
LVGKHDYFG